MARARKNEVSEEWKQSFLGSLAPLTERGDYKAALKIAKEGLKKFPREFVCRYQYAKLLGDWADELPPSMRKKKKKEAVSILRPLLRRLGGIPLKQRFGICVNFYYQSGRWLPMYRFGRRFGRQDRQLGYYAQGLAAGLEAYERHEKRKDPRPWAMRSVKAWERYDLAKEKYYFAHYSFAKSLALAGHKKTALAALKKAARLGKRPLSDWEFADVRALLEPEAE